MNFCLVLKKTEEVVLQFCLSVGSLQAVVATTSGVYVFVSKVIFRYPALPEIKTVSEHQQKTIAGDYEDEMVRIA